MSESVAFIKKHLTLYNKMVRNQTYKAVSKMKADKVREIFKRDFRKIKSGKDGTEFYSPRKYEIELDDSEEGTQKFKDLSINKNKKKPQKTQSKKDRLDEAEGKKKGKEKKSQSVSSRLHEAEGKKKAEKETKVEKKKIIKKHPKNPYESNKEFHPKTGKEVEKAWKFLHDNKNKLKKIDTYKTTSYGRAKDSNLFDEGKLKLRQTKYGTEKKSSKRIEFMISK